MYVYYELLVCMYVCMHMPLSSRKLSGNTGSISPRISARISKLSREQLRIHLHSIGLYCLVCMYVCMYVCIYVASILLGCLANDCDVGLDRC